jgi:hypothetical protein
MWPADIDFVWGAIRARAARWLADEPGGAERLFAECHDREAFPFCSRDGVLVLSLVPSPAGWDLFVRLAVSFDGQQIDHLLYEGFLDKVALDLGATRIRFRTRRRGWGRNLSKAWRCQHVDGRMEFVRDVDGQRK